MTTAARVSSMARTSIATLVALTLLEVLWAIVLAPLPGARWVAVKALPLAILLPGVAGGRLRPRQWLVLLLPFYFAEAIVRALTEPGRPALVAAMAAALSLLCFVAALAWFRAERQMLANGPSTRG